eukprot:TRINITY_DN1990_c0_g1_i9.p1 TRINITY_DN1990_c0_g1~~TRINITY_DN1990_c0_g1_i9.p1  ORF type:complete len:315 (+),score=-30.44 TRINITY_DN1990_c0_g1_i9:762-1706(+)
MRLSQLQFIFQINKKKKIFNIVSVYSASIDLHRYTNKIYRKNENLQKISKIIIYSQTSTPTGMAKNHCPVSGLSSRTLPTLLVSTYKISVQVEIARCDRINKVYLQICYRLQCSLENKNVACVIIKDLISVNPYSHTKISLQFRVTFLVSKPTNSNDIINYSTGYLIIQGTLQISINKNILYEWQNLQNKIIIQKKQILHSPIIIRNVSMSQKLHYVSQIYFQCKKQFRYQDQILLQSIDLRNPQNIHPNTAALLLLQLLFHYPVTLPKDINSTLKIQIWTYATNIIIKIFQNLYKKYYLYGFVTVQLRKFSLH